MHEVHGQSVRKPEKKNHLDCLDMIYESKHDFSIQIWDL